MKSLKVSPLKKVLAAGFKALYPGLAVPVFIDMMNSISLKYWQSWVRSIPTAVLVAK